jgi:peptide/nickel transport system permease protein
MDLEYSPFRLWQFHDFRAAGYRTDFRTLSAYPGPCGAGAGNIHSDCDPVRCCISGKALVVLGLPGDQIGMAIPSFWLGILLLLLLSVKVQIFPLFGSGTLKHLILPAVSLGIARAAVLLRLTRASMVEELSKEYVVAARSKGLTERMVYYKHALKNALLPVITIAGIQLGYMLGGAIIIEQVFSLPGLGRLFLFGIYQRDFPLIQGGVVFVAFIFSFINFAVDMLYSIVNPKIRIS